nr:GGDEF domain-containing protein [Chitinivorax tropicus]
MALKIIEPLVHESCTNITPRDLGFVQSVTADACFRLGEWSRGEHYLDLADTTLGGDDDPFFVGYLAFLHAQLLAQQGQSESALAQCDIAIAASERSHDDQLILDVINLQSQIHADRGDYQHAYQLARAFHQRYTRVSAFANETRYLTLQVQHELAEAQSARDRARKEHAEAEQARQKLSQLNRQLEERIEEIESLQSALREQAIRDALTGLYNRRHLQDALPQALQLATRTNWNVCVALIDLDHFKRLNDTHGHRLGDLALIELGKVLRDGIRGSDFCCRYGGEEFCIVLADMPASAAQLRLNGLLQQLKARLITDGESQFSGLAFSAGIASTDRFGHDPQRLLDAADKALYQAKAAGRGIVMIAEVL